MESNHQQPSTTDFDARRLRQLSSILVRNVSLNPLRDRALRSLAYHSSSNNNTNLDPLQSNDQDSRREPLSFPPGAIAADDTDLALTQRQKEKDKRNSIIRRNSGGRDRDSSKRRRRNSLSATLDLGSGTIRASGFIKGKERDRSGDTSEKSIGEGGRDRDNGNGNGTLPRPAIKRAASSATHLKGKEKEFQSTSSFDEDEENAMSISISNSGTSPSSFNPTTTTTTSSPSSIMRPRTTSTTSWASGKSGKSSLSVRFDASSSSNLSHSPCSGGNKNHQSIRGTSTWTAKALENVMRQRLCESYVTLSLPSDPSSSNSKSETKPGNSSRIFYKTQPSAPSVHASWGLTPPIDPSKDFELEEEEIDVDKGSSSIDLGCRSRFIVTFHGRNQGKSMTESNDRKGKGVDRNEWQVLFEREIELGELERIGSNLAESSISLSPNSVLLGLTTTSSRESPSSSSTSQVQESSSSSSRKDTSSDALRRAQASSHVCYYLVRPPSISSDEEPHPKRSSFPAGSDSFQSDSEREDYNSDPEFGNTITTTRRRSNSTLDRRKRVAALAAARNEHRAVIERSLRETRMMKSYEIEELKSLLETQEILRKEAKEERDLRLELDLELDRETSPFKLALRHGQQTSRLEKLQSQVKAEKADVEERRKTLSSRREALSKRKERLEAAKSLLEDNEKKMNDQKEKIKELKQVQSDLSVSLYNRRVSLLRSLEVIFPIELIDASTLLFTINGLALPNNVSDDKTSTTPKNQSTRSLEKEALSSSTSKFSKIDEESIASALGLVAQLVTLLSSYLSTPVHYPIATAGSRAVILDRISVMSGPRTFPLYSKGVESYRFEYAVFLLNKDIEQLMNCNHITLLDLKHTLPNLKNLILTLTAVESNPNSHMSRKKLVGKKEIALKSEREKENTQFRLGKGLPSSSSEVNSLIRSRDQEDKAELKSSQQNGNGIEGKSSSGWGSSLFSGWRGGSTISKINEDKKEESESDQAYPIVRRLG